MKTRAIALFLLCGLWHSSGVTQWQRMYHGLPWYVGSLAFDGTCLFAGEPGPYGGISRSTDAGANWTRVADVLTLGEVRALVVSQGALFAGTANGVFRSTDEGATWERKSDGIPAEFVIHKLAVLGTKILAAGQQHYGPHSVLFMTSDNGATWEPGGTLGAYPVSILVANGKVFAGTLQGVYRSFNEGASWEPANEGIGNFAAVSLASLGGQLFAGTDGGGVFRSSDEGSHWVCVHPGYPPTRSVYALGTDNASLVGGFCDGPILRSEDRGSSWTDTTDGHAAGSGVTEFASGLGYLFAGYEIGGVWRRPLRTRNQTLSAKPSAKRLQTSSIVGNYPNPFNPMTTIEFTVAGDGEQASGVVTLVIYDMLGQQVARLVDEQKPAGAYRVSFDGSRLSAGTYVYRLTVDATTVSRKMLLVK